MERVGLVDAPYTIKDIRAKAMTDAKRLGHEIDQLQIAGAHTDASTTRGYISHEMCRFHRSGSRFPPRNEREYHDALFLSAS